MGEKNNINKTAQDISSLLTAIAVDADHARELVKDDPTFSPSLIKYIFHIADRIPTLYSHLSRLPLKEDKIRKEVEKLAFKKEAHRVKPED